MMGDDNDGQMIFGDLGGLMLPDICLTGEEKPRKKLTQEICPDRGSNPGPLRDRRVCCRLAHSGGHHFINAVYLKVAISILELWADGLILLQLFGFFRLLDEVSVHCVGLQMCDLLYLRLRLSSEPQIAASK